MPEAVDDVVPVVRPAAPPMLPRQPVAHGERVGADARRSRASASAADSTGPMPGPCSVHLPSSLRATPYRRRAGIPLWPGRIAHVTGRVHAPWRPTTRPYPPPGETCRLMRGQRALATRAGPRGSAVSSGASVPRHAGRERHSCGHRPRPLLPRACESPHDCSL